MAPDRIEQLRQRDDLVGLDFVFVGDDHQTLSIFFYPSATRTAEEILGEIRPAQIRIDSLSGGVVPLDAQSPPAWVTVADRSVLRLRTAVRGGFFHYRFRLQHPQVDPYFQELDFRFTATCKSDLDCVPRPHDCADEPLVDYPVNYQARDFWSIRQALLDFAADRHPAWTDRLEADVGMMLTEVMSAIGDECAYYQDRVSRESYLETATQRRSLRRHARLVDYHVHDGKGGTTWLDVAVDGSAPVHALFPGTPVWVPPSSALPTDRAEDRRGRSPAVYEVGHGLVQGHQGLTIGLDVLASQRQTYPDRFNLRAGANELLAYQWDDREPCLSVGSTVLWVSGHHVADLPLEDFSNPDVPGKWVVLKTSPNDAAVPARTWLVRVIHVLNEVDPLTGADITRLEWEPAQATAAELEFETLTVRGNLVPATAGETLEAFFEVEPEPSLSALSPPLPPHVPSTNPYYTERFSTYAIERSTLLFTLPGSEQRDVVRHGIDLPHAVPEVRVMGRTRTGEAWNHWEEWEWKRALLGVSSSSPTDRHFTLEDGAWRRVAGYRRVDETGTLQEFVHHDYANGHGTTVRFGDGEFGERPTRGMQFRVVYRLGHGRRDNLAVDSLTDFDRGALPFVTAVTNVFGVTNACDPETATEVRQAAPHAFRAETYRAVRAEDYAAAVERLDWVQRAGAQFRWTGSWLTLFATPDPNGRFTLTDEERLALERQLDRYRLAGREAHGMVPQFAMLDLDIHVCVAPTAYRGAVEEAVLEALFGRRGIRPRPGFFSPDNWTFGVPLERAQLEAAIQAVPGVRAVEDILLGRRAWFPKRPFTELVYRVAVNEIIRVENNPEWPERGAVRLAMEGGA